MKSTYFKAALAASAIMTFGTASADFGVGVKAGTLGLGLEGRWNPLPMIDFRVGANAYDYDTDESTSGIDYDATLELDSYYITGNINFPLSPLRLTAGVFANNNEVALTSQDTGGQDIELGGIPLPADVVGTVSGRTYFEDVAPYAGIGIDFEIFDKVGLNFDVGVLWQGEPKVGLTADGTGSGLLPFEAALELERQQLEDDLSDYKAYPVVSLAFIYNF